MKMRLLMTVAVVFAISAAEPLNADTVAIVADADATVDSNGALGQELIEGETSIETSMSGGSNISDGLFEFDLSIIPEGGTVTSAFIQLKTSSLVSNTGEEAPIEFFGFTGNGTLDLDDQANEGSIIASSSFAVGTPADTDLEIELTNLAPLNNTLSDSNPDDYLTVRSETENFVIYLVHSLESETANSEPTLVVTFSGGLLLGDLNEDCSVDLFDISPFVDAITSGTFIAEADINQDGLVDLFDVAPFVALLTGS